MLLSSLISKTGSLLRPSISKNTNFSVILFILPSMILPSSMVIFESCVFNSFSNSLDLGFERAQISFEKFILIPHLDIDKIFLENRDYKSELLIYFQKKGIKISFQTLKDEECNDGLQFMCNIIANGKKIGLGKGSSKKIAEQSASKNALSEI